MGLVCLVQGTLPAPITVLAYGKGSMNFGCVFNELTNGLKAERRLGWSRDAQFGVNGAERGRGGATENAVVGLFGG